MYARFVSLGKASLGSTGVTIRQRASLSRRHRIRASLSDFLALTKPRTIHLVVGAIPAMLLAARGVGAPLLMVNTLIGAVLMTAGANTLNCVVDADIDKLMKRTASRPLARGAVSTRYALVFGLSLSGGAFLWLWRTTTVLAGLLALATIAFYVLVYTLLIKRRTSHNVVWGGVANGMPVMIGWSAVTGTIGWQAVVMVMIVFFWTPPHSWALAMRHSEDYRARGRTDAAGRCDRTPRRHADSHLYMADGVCDAVARARHRLDVRHCRAARRGVAARDGPPALCSGAARRVARCTAGVSAVQHLPGSDVLRAGGGFCAGPADAAGALTARRIRK